MVFSDYFFKFDALFKKGEVVVLVTDANLFVMLLKDYQIINFAELKDLTEIITIKTNSSLFALHFEGDTNDVLFESYRRTEFIIFLL